MHLRPEFILVNLSVEFADNASADDIESIIAGMDRRIKLAYPNVKRVFVEAEAWRAKDIPGNAPTA